MIVLIDANVLISASLNRASVPAQVLMICENRSWRIITSGESIEEYRRAMLSKARWKPDDVSEAVESLREAVDVIEPTMQLVWPGLKDPDDGHLFDAALYAGADVLVTGDRIVREYLVPNFPLKTFNPREFVERFA